MESDKDYRPPGWITTWFDQVRLYPERAQKLFDLRIKLCNTLGKGNEACNVNNLWIKALDLLLASEESK